MTFNPYLDSNDDDILEDDPPSFDESSVGNHNASTRDLTELPNVIKDSLEDIIGEHDGKVAVSALQIDKTFTIISGLLSFFSELADARQPETLTLAIADMLDEMTGGELSKRMMFHQSRRELIVFHALFVYVSSLQMALEKDSKPETLKSSQYCTFYKEFLQFSLDKATRNYTDLCAYYEMEPDASLIENGVITNRSIFEKVLFGPAPALGGE